MTQQLQLNGYGTLTEPTTLRIERLLPGPVERAWAYLTESDLRRQWLAAGDMELKTGAAFELVWRNGELTNPPGKRPEGFGDEHRMKSRIIEVDAPRKLAFTWGESGNVTITLEPKGGDVLLTLIHRRLDDRNSRLMVGAGWHAHLDLLVARASGQEQSGAFWEVWTRLKSEYDGRMPR